MVMKMESVALVMEIEYVASTMEMKCVTLMIEIEYCGTGDGNVYCGIMEMYCSTGDEGGLMWHR